MNIDPTHRAWFITDSRGLIGSPSTHQSLLKNTFKEEWEKLREAGEEPYQIANTFEKRLLYMDGIKIGENKGFDFKVRRLNDDTKEKLVEFTSALIKVKPFEKNTAVRIEELFFRKVYSYTMEQVANGVLKEIKLDTKELYNLLTDEEKALVDEEVKKLMDGTKEFKAWLQACKDADD